MCTCTDAVVAQVRSHAFWVMSLTKLSSCHLDEVLTCLGPDYHYLRGACLLARDRCSSADLPLEILKWHCVNSALLGNKLHCLEVMGRIPVRCSLCSTRSKTRQIYRYSRARMSDGHRLGACYLCCVCVLSEIRLFLTGVQDCSIAQASNGRSREQAELFVAIMSRVRVPSGGFAAQCLASMRPSERQ